LSTSFENACPPLPAGRQRGDKASLLLKNKFNFAYIKLSEK